MKELINTIEELKKNLPESSIRIREILVDLLNEIELSMESIPNEEELLRQIEGIYHNLEILVDRLDLGFGQLHLLDGIPIKLNQEIRRPSYKDFVVDRTKPHTLNENMRHIRPFGFTFKDEDFIEAHSWKKLYIRTCQFLYSKHQEKFVSFINKTYMNGDVRDYFSKVTETMIEPFKLDDNLFIETKFDANTIRDLIVKILKELGHNTEDYSIYFRADYNPIHRL